MTSPREDLIARWLDTVLNLAMQPNPKEGMSALPKPPGGVE